ncbi:unannotated protein [freshwater metagenome]|uniref:Unannotated protein n=1 Tax=freshwater metagenome TaxID=449393 RepID=A0A6J6YIG8_9ZZZZ
MCSKSWIDPRVSEPGRNQGVICQSPQAGILAKLTTRSHGLLLGKVRRSFELSRIDEKRRVSETSEYLGRLGAERVI